MKCRVRLCGAAWDCRREVYDLQMSEFLFGFCILVIPCCCNLYRFPLERVHAVRHWHLNSGELPPCWELRPLGPFSSQSIGRAQHFGRGQEPLSPTLCSAPSSQRGGSPQLPVPGQQCWVPRGRRGAGVPREREPVQEE